MLHVYCLPGVRCVGCMRAPLLLSNRGAWAHLEGLAAAVVLGSVVGIRLAMHAHKLVKCSDGVALQADRHEREAERMQREGGTALKGARKGGGGWLQAAGGGRRQGSPGP